MKEKKSNLKNKEVLQDEQTSSIIRLIGLFMIVYGILCFTSKNMGSILSVPFTFLVGSFSSIALLIVIILGCYMLLFKKMFNGFKTYQYVLISLLIIFALVLATHSPMNYDMSIKSCFNDYLHADGANYSWNVSIVSTSDGKSIETLGGGMLGYIFYGLINTITGANSTITLVISWIIFGGLAFILLAPYVSRFIKFIVKVSKKSSEKRKEKKKLKLEKKEQEELLKKQQEEAKKPINFNVEEENGVINSKQDDLLETTEINITGDNYSYVEETDRTSKKLSNLLNAFDDEIYPMSYKKVSIHDTLTETHDVRLFNTYEDDFKTEEVTNVYTQKDLNDSINTNKEEVSPTVILNENIVIPSDDEVTGLEGGKVILNEIKETKDVEVKLEPTSNTFVLNETNENTNNQNINIKEEKDLYNVDYDLPPLYLLKDATDNGANAQNIDIARQKADILMEKMKELNVAATINAFVVGPSVTRFEIALAPGVRVGSFTNLQEDFKLALGVNSIRIESPIPGKSAIGIEVPNTYRAMVSMKEIITQMPNKKHKLYVPVGKDITGVPLSFPICDMPHCLISGATNSGKSVCANTIILSLLMNYKPSEVRLIMVDPKRVEMSFYNEIPHLMCPIITESEKARVALEKLCVEMDKRFTTFSKFSVKNIASYNELMVSQNKNKMPFIILIVDEFAELMLCRNHNIVEEKIQKIAQLGRAAGIHLILSTQRPDVNVIPGTIKSNLPCRMTFRLSSLVDSRTVIDVGGAEKLLNNGDMLLLTPDFTGLRRVQGVYVSDKEIIDVVEYCKKQLGPQYDENFLDLRSAEEKAEEEKLKYALQANDVKEESNEDPMFEDIKRFVIKEQKASTSYLQRKFNIGYSRAARYIDMLEEQGVVGPENGSRPREVLISNEEDLNE